MLFLGGVPLLALLFFLSFVGVGAALILLMSWTWLFTLVILLAKVLVGTAIAGWFWDRYLPDRRLPLLWDALSGSLVFWAAGQIPVAGYLISALLVICTAGAMFLLIIRNFCSRPLLKMQKK